jgi:hypothetical protein
MYALAAPMVPEHAPMKMRVATRKRKVGAKDEAIMPMPEPASVTVMMRRRPILSLSGPIQKLERSCAIANDESMKPSDEVAPPSLLHTASVQGPVGDSQPQTNDT